MDDGGKGDKKDQKGRKSGAKRLRDTRILALSMSGHNSEEIAEEVGIRAQQVRRILNGSQIRGIAEEGESRIAELVPKAISVVEAAMDQNMDLGNALKAAIVVLKSLGVAKDSAEVIHKLPKRTVIHRRDGSQTILGYEEDENNGDDR